MEDINQLIAIQDDRVLKINKAFSNYRKTPKQRFNICYLNTRLESLDKSWQSFISTHERIISIANKESKITINYFTKDVFDETEELYITYKSELQMRILELTQQEQGQQTSQNPKQSTNTNSGTEIKLPTINLPTFSGIYMEWPSFHDLFTSLVHNNKVLDNVQKLHYLKSSLSGEAEQLLRTFTVTGDNYTQAWTTLTKRYSNKRYISNSIFKRLFALKTLTTESALNIKLLLDTTVECLNLLNNIGLQTDHWDAIIVYMTVSKLDAESHKLWEQNISSETDAIPSFETLKLFLESRFRSLEMIEPNKISRQEPHKSTRQRTFHTTTSTSDMIKCALCNDTHYLYNCKQFAKKNSTERYNFVRNANLCFNCLIPNHSVTKCMKPTCCRICKKRHHSLLHPEKEATSAQESVMEENHTQLSNITTHFINQPGQVLLATALVDVRGRGNDTHIYRALIDQGSQASFVTESLVQACGLKRERISGVISGLSDGKQLRTKYMVQLEIQSKYKPHLVFPVNAYVLRTLTSYIPSQETTVCNWPDLEYITLADPGYNTPNRIDLLLGAEVYSKIIDTGVKKSPNGVVAQYTHLGWILSGDTRNEESVNQRQMISMHICTCENELLQKFWEIENETLTSKRKFSVEEERCEDIYRQTVTRTNSGRYKVNLPFKDDIRDPVEKCGDTKQVAITRFLKLEKKLSNDVTLREEYTRVINEYLELDHMTIAKEDNNKAIYLPHRAVVRNDKDTTKVRVVFDASAKGSKGVSLNETLLVGPTIQKDLPTLLMKWRKYKIAIVSDIVKMYRQVLIADADTEVQRIVWRNHPDDDLQFYKLLTVTFGTASAPYLAIRTLFQLTEDEGHKYPIAAEIVKNSFYVDDLTTGCYTIEEGRDIYQQLTQLLRCGGFELQKWSSNSLQFLEAISQNKSICNQQPFAIKLDDNIKILGLMWDKQNDNFKFKVNLEEAEKPITKRKILSDVARLFDPFGWLSPTIIIAKVFIQKLWLCNADWDEEVPNHLLQEWIKFRRQLIKLQDIHINRWIYTYQENTHVELHGFADASISAYAAVIYVKVINNGEIKISILESKTKVAPLKQISAARVVCAVVLLTKLLSRASETLDIPKHHVYAYTNLMIVLAWIQSQPTKWQTFVDNPVAEIQDLLQSDRLNHVTAEHNPADLETRGLYPADLTGEDVLWNETSCFRTENMLIRKTRIPETEEENRKVKIKACHIHEQEESIYQRSTFNKMIHVLTYCRRILHLKENKEIRRKHTQHLSSKELREMLNKIIKINQEKDFEQKISVNNKVKLRSKLIKFVPYLNDIELLRMGDRLQSANVAAEVKHLTILSQTSHLKWLLVDDAHTKLLHGGYSLMMYYLRSHGWINGLKQVVKRRICQCVVCIRHKIWTHLDRWDILISQHFWRRWANQLLNTLQQRHKRHRGIESPKIGRLVISKEEDTPPGRWLMLKIGDSYPSKDTSIHSEDQNFYIDEADVHVTSRYQKRRLYKEQKFLVGGMFAPFTLAIHRWQ